MNYLEELKDMSKKRDLINTILTDAVYYVNWLMIDLSDADFEKYRSDHGCYEDIWTDALMDGASIIVYDNYDNGKQYSINLQDFDNGLGLLLGYDRHKWARITANDGTADSLDMYDLMLFVVFKELKY